MNYKNVRDHLDEVQQKISYWFDNTDLLLQAFTRSSYSKQYGGENNELRYRIRHCRLLHHSIPIET